MIWLPLFLTRFSAFLHHFCSLLIFIYFHLFSTSIIFSYLLLSSGHALKPSGSIGVLWGPWGKLISQDYHHRITRPNGEKGWAGGKDLAASAAFTGFFCRALLRCWLESQPPILQPPPRLALPPVDEEPAAVEIHSGPEEEILVSDWFSHVPLF